MFDLTEPLSLKVIGLAVGAGLFLSLLLGVALGLRPMWHKLRQRAGAAALSAWQQGVDGKSLHPSGRRGK